MNTVPEDLVKDFNNTFGRMNDEWAEMQTRAYERGLRDGLRDRQGEIDRLCIKLRRVRDRIKFAANSDRGIVAEIDRVIEPKEDNDVTR